MWGLGAAVCAWGASIAFDSPFMAVIAKVGAFLNLFNLTPVWQLDGAHAFCALTRQQRWIATAIIGGALAVSSEHLLILVGGVAVFRCFGKDAPAKGDTRALVEYAILTLALTALASLPVARSLVPR